jgi:hypothetical protein
MSHKIHKPLKDRSGPLESGAHDGWIPPEQLNSSQGVHSGVPVSLTFTPEKVQKKAEEKLGKKASKNREKEAKKAAK